MTSAMDDGHRYLYAGQAFCKKANDLVDVYYTCRKASQPGQEPNLQWASDAKGTPFDEQSGFQVNALGLIASNKGSGRAELKFKRQQEILEIIAKQFFAEVWVQQNPELTQDLSAKEKGLGKKPSIKNANNSESKGKKVTLSNSRPKRLDRTYSSGEDDSSSDDSSNGGHPKKGEKSDDKKVGTNNGRVEFTPSGKPGHTWSADAYKDRNEDPEIVVREFEAGKIAVDKTTVLGHPSTLDVVCSAYKAAGYSLPKDVNFFIRVHRMHLHQIAKNIKSIEKVEEWKTGKPKKIGSDIGQDFSWSKLSEPRKRIESFVKPATLGDGGGHRKTHKRKIDDTSDEDEEPLTSRHWRQRGDIRNAFHPKERKSQNKRPHLESAAMQEDQEPSVATQVQTPPLAPINKHDKRDKVSPPTSSESIPLPQVQSRGDHDVTTIAGQLAGTSISHGSPSQGVEREREPNATKLQPPKVPGLLVSFNLSRRRVRTPMKKVELPLGPDGEVQINWGLRRVRNPMKKVELPLGPDGEVQINWGLRRVRNRG